MNPQETSRNTKDLTPSALLHAAPTDLSPLAARLKNSLSSLLASLSLHPATPMLVAISGGADSVALACLLQEIQRITPSAPLMLGHVNHGLRGTESDADERFVREFGHLRGWAVLSSRISMTEPGNKASEAILRELRYEALIEQARTCSARIILTAHTADDQAETILHRIVRGAGLAGLRGIRPVRRLEVEERTERFLIRPLLQFRRDELREYLRSREQSWREDSSNALPHYTRNFLRQTVFPLLSSVNPRVTEALIRLGEQAVAAETVIEQAARELLATMTFDEARQRFHWPRASLRQSPSYILQEALKMFWEEQGWGLGNLTAKHLSRAAAIIQARETHHTSASPRVAVLPGDVHLQRRKDEVLVWKKKSGETGEFDLNENS